MSAVAKVHSAAPLGFTGFIVEVESDASRGLPGLQIVGLANKAIDEAKERVRSAITNSLLEFPARKLTINLAPAELPKDGTHYDLPIALSILISSGQLLQTEVEDAVFAGELALDGSLRATRGIIAIVEAAKEAGVSKVYVPTGNLEQASLIPGIDILGVSTLKSLFLHLKGEQSLLPHTILPRSPSQSSSLPILDDIKGQEQAKRALIIAAAGHHNILLSGPPGAGKTMLARTLPTLLDNLSATEKIAVTKLHSLAGESIEIAITQRPFRAPHHSASRTAIIGGGTKPRPGEVSLAHTGVLFLDEIPEYPRSLLEALRQPLEDKVVSISRINSNVTYPADFMLVATMNPCPCGFAGDASRECTCTTMQILSYQKKLSGPLLDRIDMNIQLSRVPNDTLLEQEELSKGQQSMALSLLKVARQKQLDRYKSSTKNNSNITSKEVRTLQLSPEARQLLKNAADKLNLSARSYFKVIKVAQTIADLDNAQTITAVHLSEALQYRQNS